MYFKTQRYGVESRGFSPKSSRFWWIGKSKMLDLVTEPSFGCVLLLKVLFSEESLQINLYLMTYKYIAVYFMACIFSNYASSKIEESSKYIK